MSAKTKEENSSEPVEEKVEETTAAVASTEKPKKKHRLLKFSFVLLVLVVLAAGVYYFTSKSKGKVATSTSKESGVHKVVGKSQGKLPYAPVDDKKTVSRVFGKNGGVISTDLPNNVKAYLVVPEGEVIMNATMSLIPYKEMPSSQKHGELSDELGYGVQVSIKSVQMGTGGYLVFDTKGGKATEEAAKKAKYFNRCDPRFSWFDPFLCGVKNKVYDQVNKDYTVVTPIFNDKAGNPVFTKNTIQTGIDGLIAIRIEKGDVYIPQKLDQSLVKKFAASTISEKSDRPERLEAAGLAAKWGVQNFSYDQMSALSISDGENWQERTKKVLIYKDYLSRIKGNLVKIVSENKENEKEDRERIIKDFEEGLHDELSEFYQDAREQTKTFGFEYDSVAAVGGIAVVSHAGAEGASEAANDVGTNIENNVGDSEHPDNAQGAGEGAGIAKGDEDFNLDYEEAKEKANAIIENTLNNPDATIPELLQAVQLAQLLGLDNEAQITEKAMAKIKKILEDKLKDENLSKKQLLDIAALAQMLGFNDIANEALRRAGIEGGGSSGGSGGGSGGSSGGMSAEDCDLVKKDLSNYGINDCGE